jgi:hypothetical protein
MKSLLFAAVLFFFSFCFSLNASAHTMKKFVCGELPQFQGWCSQEKAITLMDLVLNLKPDVCVEIGVFGGASLFPVATALKYLGKGIVIGIDPWDNRNCISCYDPVEKADHLKWWTEVDLLSIYKKYLEMQRYYELEDYCLTIVSTSAKAAPLIKKIDILHIDANSCEDELMQDLHLYFPKVRSGGVICLPISDLANQFLADKCHMIKCLNEDKCCLYMKQ